MDRSKVGLNSLVGAAFFTLGIVVGTLLALSAQSLAQAVVAALFATFGGSIVLFLDKLSAQNQLQAFVALFAVSAGTLAGTYSGIYVNEHLLLTPGHRRTDQLSDSRPIAKYLRDETLSRAATIDTKYRNQELKAPEAYEELRQTLESD